MLRSIKLLVFLFLFLFFLLSFAKAGDYDKYYINIPKLIDCQTIKIDETFLNEKKAILSPVYTASTILICFWEVEIKGKKLILLKRPGRNEFGVVNE